MTEPLPESSRLAIGVQVPVRTLEDVRGRGLRTPAAEGLTHLQFRRFAGCPVCDLHLRTFARRHDEIVASGIVEAAVFHSSREALAPHALDLPFHVIPDPGKQLYRAFRIEAGWRAVASPAAWGAIARSVGAKLRAAIFEGASVSVDATGGRLGLPADFLLSPSGRIVACHYGEHVYDQWSVDDLLTIAAEVREKSDAAAA